MQTALNGLCQRVRFALRADFIEPHERKKVLLLFGIQLAFHTLLKSGCRRSLCLLVIFIFDKAATLASENSATLCRQL